jgi:hypothetical protein
VEVGDGGSTVIVIVRVKVGRGTGTRVVEKGEGKYRGQARGEIGLVSVGAKDIAT